MNKNSWKQCCRRLVMMLLPVIFTLTGCSQAAGNGGKAAEDGRTVTWGWERIPKEDQISQEGRQADTGTTRNAADAAATGKGDAGIPSIMSDSDAAAGKAVGIEEGAGTGRTAEQESWQDAEQTKEAEYTGESYMGGSEPAPEESDASCSGSSTNAEPMQITAHMSQLGAQIEEKLAGVSGTWAVYVKDLTSKKSLSLYNQAMVSASLIKLYIAGAYYDAVQKETIQDLYGDSLDIMLRRSDNDAANELIDVLGYAAINDFIEQQNFRDDATVLERRMLEQTTRENYTSVMDCGVTLERILAGTYVNAAASRRILSDLKAQERTSKIPAGVPAGIETANKTGELSNVENDAAIIWAPHGTYILVIMSENLTDTSQARTTITDISTIVYDALN